MNNLPKNGHVILSWKSSLHSPNAVHFIWAGNIEMEMCQEHLQNAVFSILGTLVQWSVHIVEADGLTSIAITHLTASKIVFGHYLINYDKIYLIFLI